MKLKSINNFTRKSEDINKILDKLIKNSISKKKATEELIELGVQPSLCKEILQEMPKKIEDFENGKN